MAKKVKKIAYNRIKEVMAENNAEGSPWTVSMLALRIRKSRVVVSNYVHNNKQPSLPTLKKIADVLGVSPKDLIND